MTNTWRDTRVPEVETMKCVNCRGDTDVERCHCGAPICNDCWDEHEALHKAISEDEIWR
jgi:reverse gyrase